MMIYITVKSLGKKKNYITQEAFELKGSPSNLKELIIDIVQQNVERFNHQKSQIPLLKYLTEEEITLQGSTGKIGFKAKYNEGRIDRDEAIKIALSAFEDGLYKVVIGEGLVEGLEVPLNLKDQDNITFIKLIMLAGRLW